MLLGLSKLLYDIVGGCAPPTDTGCWVQIKKFKCTHPTYCDETLRFEGRSKKKLVLHLK